MIPYICDKGHVQYGSGVSDKDYFPNCSNIGCDSPIHEKEETIFEKARRLNENYIARLKFSGRLPKPSELETKVNE